MKKILLFLSVIATATSAANAQNSNVGIGTVTPEKSARIEVNAPNKGMLFPRVSLQSGSDIATIATPAHSLLVFNINDNLATPDGSGRGYYYNFGTPTAARWIRMSSGTVSSAKYLGTPDGTKLVAMGDFEFRYSTSDANGNVQMRRNATAPDRNVNILRVVNTIGSPAGFTVTSGPNGTVSTNWVNIGTLAGASGVIWTVQVDVPATNEVYRITCYMVTGSEMLLVEKL
jgi:hypothetical protein